MAFERVADIISQASEAEIANTEASVAAVRKLANEPIPEGWDKETCFICEDDLPKARAEAGRFRCIACQTKFEKRKGGYL